MSAVDELRSQLTRRIAQAEEELARLRGALAAYDRAHADAPKPNAGTAGRRRVAGALSAESVLETLSSGSLSRAEICERTGGSDRSVLAVLKQLEASGQVAREGERRATKWLRVTRRRARASAVTPSRRKRTASKPKPDGPTAPAASGRQAAAATGAADTAAKTAPSKRPATSSKERPATAARQRPATAAKERSATPASSRSASRSEERPAPRRPRARRELAPGQIEELLAQAPNGLSVVALARQAQVNETAIRERLTELERTGRVRSSGSRRTSLWRLLSDEEWVAERAAQLSQTPAERS